MLELVIGFSGSGKSHYIFEEIGALAEAGEQPLFLLVPEQASFETERALLARLGAATTSRVRVYSFTRLAEAVFREVGGCAGDRLDDGTRALLMSRALEQVAAVEEDMGTPMAGLTPGRRAQAAYVEQLLALWEEMKQNGVATEALEAAAAALQEEGTGSTLLQEKAAELYRVFAAYEGLAKGTGLDDLDTLTLLAQRLPRSGLLEGAAVFVDGFKGFTAQELAVLEGVVTAAERLTVALGTDTPGAAWLGARDVSCRREFPLFMPVTETVEQLHRLAANHGRRWQLHHLTHNHRAAHPALAALESQLYTPAPEPYEGEAACVTVTPCPDVYEECMYVARQVRRLLREEGYRCRDITLVARQVEDYRGILEDALAQQGVPCYMDARQDLLCEPLVVYARAALRLAVGGWSSEEMLRLLKTDLSPLEPVDTAQLENYVFMWRIEGAAWERGFTENPAGLGAPVTPATARQLATLNEWRQQVMTPLISLRHALRGTVTGREFALAMYRYLAAEDTLAERIAQQCARLEQLAEPVLADHATRLWDELMRVLDRFATALGDQPLPASRMEELFTMLCQYVDMGSIPQSVDAVTVGVAHRIRYAHPRAVFILGANEGVFPAYPATDGIFTEGERETLKAKGVALSGDSLSRCVEERYYAYTAVAAPSEKLIVTYQTGGGLVASPLVEAVRRILPRHTRGQARREDGYDLESGEEMFRRMAETYGRPVTAAASLQAVLADRPDYAGRMAAVERSAGRGPFRLEQPDTARALFGTDMCLSASQTERFYTCHFAYFCRYGLHVQARRVAQVDASIFGVLVHHAMESLLPRYTAPEGLVAQLRARGDVDETAENRLQADLMRTLGTDVQQVLDEYMAREMGGAENKSGQFFYRVGQARRAAVNMLWHTLMELRQSAFDPVDFELSIHPQGEEGQGLLSLRLPHREGSVQVRGQIDRVDIYIRKDGTAFARVVDYKTGEKTFDLNELAVGLNMQMLLYLFILCDNAGRYDRVEGNLHPAGVLYHPLSDLTVEQGEGLTQRLKTMTMSGVVLDDPGVVMAMEADAAKVFIPAGLDKEGKATGPAISAAQFALLRRVVERLLTAMADQLLAGDIEAVPMQTGKNPPCAYCDYRVVCGRDADDPVRRPDNLRMKEILDKWDVDTKDEEVTNDGQAVDGETETGH